MYSFFNFSIFSYHITWMLHCTSEYVIGARIFLRKATHCTFNENRKHIHWTLSLIKVVWWWTKALNDASSYYDEVNTKSLNGRNVSWMKCRCNTASSSVSNVSYLATQFVGGNNLNSWLKIVIIGRFWKFHFKNIWQVGNTEDGL